MKPSSTLLVGILAVTGVVGQPLDLLLMTYNVRVASESLAVGEQPWRSRLTLMGDQIKRELAGRPQSLLCFQEARLSQVNDLKIELGADWNYVGVGRDDGREAGEFSPIFYQTSEWTLQEQHTYWLSETPEVAGSLSWDAALPRIVNVARFQHSVTGAPFVYMCTHFDHQGQVAREQSAELLVRIAHEWAAEDPSVPVFLGGDLNVESESTAYQTLAKNMDDIKNVVPIENQHGYDKTYTGWDFNVTNDSRIDYIFVRDTRGLHWESFGVLNNFEKGVFISDHRPVVVKVKVLLHNAQQI